MLDKGAEVPVLVFAHRELYILSLSVDTCVHVITLDDIHSA